MRRVDIMEAVIVAVSTALPDVTVRAHAPDPRPELLVTVTREGGGRLDAYRDSPGVGVLSWAPTEARAQELAYRVAVVMESMERVHGIAKVYEETLRSNADPASGNPRWYGSYTVTTYDVAD